INEDEDIEKAIKNIRETTVANIKSDRKNINKNKSKLPKISNWYQFKYPVEGEFASFLCARPLPHFGPDLSRLTKDAIKKELNKRGIEYDEEQDKSELVIILKTNIQSKILDIIEATRQVASTNNFVEEKIIMSSKMQENKKKQVLKEMQEFGKWGGCKYMTAHITELLKSFFHAGDIDKSERYSAKDMLDALEKRAETGELENSEILKLKTIENWIGRYAQQYKKELAEKAQTLI
ncbi:33693_t:CDS:2, partial [Racocetra persica]